MSLSRWRWKIDATCGFASFFSPIKPANGARYRPISGHTPCTSERASHAPGMPRWSVVVVVVVVGLIPARGCMNVMTCLSGLLPSCCTCCQRIYLSSSTPDVARLVLHRHTDLATAIACFSTINNRLARLDPATRLASQVTGSSNNLFLSYTKTRLLDTPDTM